jgi:hypothetical protein
MKIWRITGSEVRTSGLISISASTGTSRQPSTRWPSARTVRSSSCSQARRDACSFGRNTMPTPYSPGGGRVTPCALHLGAVEVVRDLDQDAGAVAEQRVRAGRPAMVQVQQDLQTLLDDVVALRPLDVGDEADAAGVVLVGRVVQASCSWAGSYNPCLGGTMVWATANLVESAAGQLAGAAAEGLRFGRARRTEIGRLDAFAGRKGGRDVNATSFALSTLLQRKKPVKSQCISTANRRRCSRIAYRSVIPAM